MTFEKYEIKERPEKAAVIDYVTRQERAVSEPFVVSLAELLIEPFGINNRKVLERVRRVNSHFDVFVHHLDDVKDNPANGAASAHAAVTSLISGIRDIRCVNQKDMLFHRLFSYWQQASEGERHLWRHHGKLIPYDSEDFLMLGKRGAMAKTSIALYADASNNDLPVLNLEKGVEEGAVAVQLCDDIFDWEKDLESGIYTQPIVLAYQESGNLNNHQIERAVFSSNVFPVLVKTANSYLTRAGKRFELASASKLTSCVYRMRDNLTHLIEYLEELKGSGIENNLTQRIRERADPLLLLH
ncbi:MAG: hypothetical protein KKA43_04790 [Nanoarchaeota archaeon]|nr:hypothetical protein [Nanoarchaeota archaeon]